MSPTAWTQSSSTKAWLDKGSAPGQWLATDRAPSFDKQHPEAYEVAVAELAAKIGAQPELAP